MTSTWILRSLRVEEYEQLAFDHGLIAIGWSAVGDLASFVQESQTRNVVRAAFPFIGRESVESYTSQLFQFRTVMTQGDLVVLLRRSSPGIAVGWVTGDYRYRDDLHPAVRHVRAVDWKDTDLSRASVEWLLLSMPPLTMIHRPDQEDLVERMTALIEGDRPLADIDRMVTGPEASESPEPFANLQRNLNYARNLAMAGHHLDQLQVGAFEVPDVFRAAWVQGVAALDYWVRQEIRARMLRLAQRRGGTKPRAFTEFTIPIGELEAIMQSSTSLAEVLDEQLSRTRGHYTYQHPAKIREAFLLVSDVTDLWNKVAAVLNEQAGDSPAVKGNDIQKQLAGIVQRRNKIAHEYDENPEDPPAKRPIDVAAVTQTIDWLEQLAAAIIVVLGP